jgi:hypothetical protein
MILERQNAHPVDPEIQVTENTVNDVGQVLKNKPQKKYGDRFDHGSNSSLTAAS